MTDTGIDQSEVIPAVVVFLTLGAAILAFVSEGWQPAALILALGWLVVLPLSAILSEAFSPFGLGSDDERSETASEDHETVEADDALDALRRRYARGDIDEAEFERRVQLLLETEDEEEAKRALLDDSEPERETEREL